VCLLDEKTGLCVGCGRSCDEIASWSDMTSADRRAIMAILPDRLALLERLAKTEGSNA